MLTKNNENVSVDEITAENYNVPRGEELLWHVKQEAKSFDQKTGKKLSYAVVQKYNRKEFPMIQHNLMKFGYDLEILHNPDEWLKNYQKSKAIAKQKEVEAIKAKDAEIEQLKKQLAEAMQANEQKVVIKSKKSK